jgi:hypothetical protein
MNMGAYVFFVVCTSLWLAFGWALASRPAVLDKTWAGVRRLPLLAKPVVWIAFLPWLTGLAIWESNWSVPRARRVLILLVAVGFILFWAITTFQSGGGGST